MTGVMCVSDGTCGGASLSCSEVEIATDQVLLGVTWPWFQLSMQP